MTYRIEVPALLYAACAAATSDEESRPILQGIEFQRHGTHGVACATNGRALVAGRWALENDGTETLEWPDLESIILPPVKLSVIGVTPKHMRDATVVLTSSGDKDAAGVRAWNVTASIRYGSTGRSVTVYEIEGPFPHWRQVVPTGDPEPCTSFGLDPAVLSQACAVLGKCTLTFYGAMRGIVARPTDDNMGFQAFALAMPLRPDGGATGAPAWVHLDAVAV